MLEKFEINIKTYMSNIVRLFTINYKEKSKKKRRRRWCDTDSVVSGSDSDDDDLNTN